MDLKKFADQIVSLAWIKCAMEEGVKFTDKQTGYIERNEMMVFQHFEHNTGAFDLPKAEVTPKGMERCLYETIGNFFINNSQPEIRMMLESVVFRNTIQDKIKTIKDKGSKMLRGSPIEHDLDIETHKLGG